MVISVPLIATVRYFADCREAMTAWTAHGSSYCRRTDTPVCSIGNIHVVP